MAFFLILVPSAFYIYQQTRKAEAAWFNDSWGYRQTVSITSNTALTDYQIAVTMDSATLITAGKMRSDCNDIRVTDQNGNLLPYWVEGGSCNTATTRIWVKLVSINTAGNTLLVYYGNPSSPKSDSPDKVFQLFDDFKYVDGAKWRDTTGTNTVSAEGYDGNSLATSSDLNDIRFYSVASFSAGYAVKSRMKENGTDGGLFFDARDDSNGYLVASRRTGGTIAFEWYRRTTGVWSSRSEHSSVSSWTASEFRTLEIKRISTIIYVYDNESAISYTTTNGDSSYDGGSVGIRANPSSGAQTIDWIFVRKAVATEPTVNSPSNEEKAISPVANWKFDEGTGSTTSDSTVNKINASLSNITWASDDQCISGKCLKVDQKSSISIPANDKLNITGAIAISAWVKPATTSGIMPILNRAVFSSPFSGFSLELHDRKPTVLINGGRVANSVQRCSQQVDAGRFSQVTWTRDGSNTNKIYINGTECTYSSSISGVSQDSISTTTGIGSKLGKNNMAPNTDYSAWTYNTLYSPSCWGGDTGEAYFYASGGYDNLPYKKITKTGAGTGGCYKNDYVSFSIEDSKRYIVSSWIKGSRAETNLSQYATDLNRISDNAYRTSSVIQLTTNWQRTSWIYNSAAGHAGTYQSRGIVYVDTNLPLDVMWSGFQIEDVTDTDQTSPTSRFAGFIDDIKVYSYARTEDQVKLDYSSRGSVKGASSSIGNDLIQQGSLAQGLVGYWKLNEATANTCLGGVNDACDSSGSGYDGAWSGDTTASESGKFGNGVFQVDGGNGSIDMGNVLNMGTNNFTISMWVKLNNLSSPDAPELLDKMNAGTGTPGYHLRVGYNDEIEFQVGGSSGAIEANSANSAITTGRWYHVTAVYDKQNGHKIYIDGKQSGTTTTGDVGNADSTDTLKFGQGFNSWEMDGTYDEVRIYNRALSSSEVSKLYNWAPGPNAYWSFDEKSGDNVQDRTGNANLGTWSGAGNHWTQGKFGSSGLFNNSSDNVVIPLQNFKSITVEAWVNRKSVDVSNADGVFGHWYWTGDAQQRQGYDLRFYLNRDIVDWNVETTDGATVTEKQMSSPSLAYNRWYYLTGTYDSATGISRLYVDGVQVGISSASPGNTIVPLSQYSDARIGYSRVNNGYFNGSIDEVKIYNYARTPGQIIEDMNASHPIGGSPIGSQLLYLKFDEGYGSTAKNSGNGGSALNGNLTGTAAPIWSAEGRYGKSLLFSNGYVQTPAITLSTNFTYSVWFKRGAFVEWAAVLTNLKHGAPSSGLNIVPRSGSVRICYGDGVNAYSNYTVTIPEVTAGKWTHAAVTYDGTNITLYINGVQKDSRAATVAQSSQTIRTGIWASSYAGYLFDGFIDEVKVYNSALTADQIKLDYNQGKSLVLGVISTGPDGKTASSSASRAYCVPGDTSSCNPPVAEWNFEEKQGGTTNDTSGNGNTGTLNSSPAWTGGGCKIGSCLKFTNNDVSSSTGPNPTTAGTVEAWVKVNSWGTNYDSIVFKGPGVGWSSIDYGLFRDGTNQRFLGTLNDGTNNLSGSGPKTPTINTGQWYHLAFTWDASQAIIYTNGVGSTPVSWIYGAGNRSSNLRIGRAVSGSTYPFKGLIDQVKIYDYARTPAQIAWDYNQGKPIGWWKFDECQGATAHDSAGNGMDGSITIGGTAPQTTVGTCVSPADGSGAWYNGRVGKFNSSLNLEADDFVTVQHNALQAPSSITVAGWIKFKNNNNWMMINKGNAGTNGAYYIYGDNLTSNNWTIFSAAAARFDCNLGALATGSWYFLVGTFDASSGKMNCYVNGNLKNTTNGASLGTNSTNLLFGKYNPGDYFTDGQIDDIRIYNYALTPYQVKQVMNQGAAVRWGPVTGSP
ncbi:DUF2341 domain-containing protein [Patescibacteria group bacterium]|nr:DUF2341 domain-containing protein [Patescibacteria group bacterium]